jgi:hypothetical protein
LAILRAGGNAAGVAGGVGPDVTEDPLGGMTDGRYRSSRPKSGRPRVV